MRAIHAWCGAIAIGASVLAASSAYAGTPAQASSPRHAVPSQHPQRKTPPPVVNLRAAMPPGAISPTDGLPTVLVDGRSYRLTVHVGIAGGQPTTDAEVLLIGAGSSVCLSQRLPPGVISTLRCTFVAGAAGELGLQVKVLVGAAHSTQILATFYHPVVSMASST